MKPTVLTFWFGGAAVGSSAAWVCRHYGLLDLGSAALQYLGAMAALINATGWQTDRQFDTPPTKDLTPDGAERLRRLYLHRKRAFRQRWFLAVGLGIVVGLIGTLLKNKAYPEAEIWLFYGGFVALGISVILGVLIWVDYNRLAGLARDLPIHLEKERRQRELRRRLRRPGATLTDTPAEVAGKPAVR